MNEVKMNEALAIISKGADEIIHVDDLKKKLQTKETLTIKLGLDPTAPDIHLGHSVVLRKIRQFQDLGHQAVIILGDFTGRIGDPTGKSVTRKQLTEKEVIQNAKTYEEQIFRILDPSKTEIAFNSKWLAKLNFEEVMELASTYTVARMLERDDFKKRFNNHKPISIHEFFYPLMQAYDSVAIKADVELGGTDQKFNILMGRHLQKAKKIEQQVAIFMPILPGTDGVDKMSKSLGNYIGINEEATVIFGKVMSLPDTLMVDYFNLVTDIHPSEVEKIKNGLAEGDLHPREVKLQLAEEICRLYHGQEKAKMAKEHFIKTVSNREVPDDLPVLHLEESCKDVFALLHKEKIVSSNSEIRRLIQGGAVQLNGEKLVLFQEVDFKDGDILKVGKRKFFRLQLTQ